MVAKVIRHPRTGQPIEVEAETVSGPGYREPRSRRGFAGARYSDREEPQYVEDDYEDDYEDDDYDESPPRARSAREGRQSRRARRAAAADAVRNNAGGRRRGAPRGGARSQRRGRGYAGQSEKGTTVVCEAPEKSKFPWGTVALTAVVMTAVGWGVKGALDRFAKTAGEGREGGETPQPNPSTAQAPQLHPVQQLLLTSPGANRLMPAYTPSAVEAPQQVVAAVPALIEAPKKRRKKNPEPEEDSDDELLSFMDQYIRDMDGEDDD